MRPLMQVAAQDVSAGEDGLSVRNVIRHLEASHLPRDIDLLLVFLMELDEPERGRSFDAFIRVVEPDGSQFDSSACQTGVPASDDILAIANPATLPITQFGRHELHLILDGADQGFIALTVTRPSQPVCPPA